MKYPYCPYCGWKSDEPIGELFNSCPLCDHRLMYSPSKYVVRVYDSRVPVLNGNTFLMSRIDWFEYKYVKHGEEGTHAITWKD